MKSRLLCAALCVAFLAVPVGCKVSEALKALPPGTQLQSSTFGVKVSAAGAGRDAAGSRIAFDNHHHRATRQRPEPESIRRCGSLHEGEVDRGDRPGR